jgi:hypothetical protein
MKLAHATKVPCTQFAEVPEIARITARDLPTARAVNTRRESRFGVVNGGAPRNSRARTALLECTFSFQ